MLSFSFLPKIIDIKLYRTIILPDALHVRETLMEEHRQKLFFKSLLRKILWQRTTRYMGTERDCVMRGFIIFSHLQIFTDFNRETLGKDTIWRAYA
jgi:hypothetical protein